LNIGIIKRLLHSADELDISKSEKRNILLTNYISITLALACILLLILRMALNPMDLGSRLRLVLGFSLFLLPLFLNHWKFFFVSRIILCWLPSLFVIMTLVLSITGGQKLEASSYVGVRFFLIVFPCFPFLIFNIKSALWICIGLFIPLFTVIFYDPILSFFGAGYWQHGHTESTYTFNNVRAIISTSIISFSFYFLKRIVERNEELNEQLILKLEEKNKIIQKQVEAERQQLSLKQKEAEKRVMISENRYRSLFEQATDPIMITDFTGNFLDTNEYLCQMFGYTKEELMKLNIRDLIDNKQLKERPIRFDHLKEGDHVFSERNMIHKNGRIIQVEANVKKFEENAVMAIIRDVTDRNEAQEKLLLSQANLRATINNTEILIWSVDRDFRLMTFNIPFSNYIKEHYGIEIKLGSRVLEPLHSDEKILRTKNWWEQNYLRALSGEIVTIEERTRFGMDLQYSLSPIIESNNIIGVSVFAENTTERKIHERELMDANKKIGESKLMALRSVMSPHFIFNALNSIQYYIAKDDRLNAINHLSTFSKLIRSILTHSVHNKIKLSDEIDLLKNYIHLEMTRFEDKFNYVLTIDHELDLKSIELPSLLIQPYVENAILHGLYNKKEKGTLTINIFEEDEKLVFVIEDNGIGREEAIKLKQKSFPNHESMGTKLTEERLKLINEHHHASLEIIDLTINGQPSGTKVTIQIAIE
jgi:PAS domain S-box-containing protein